MSISIMNAPVPQASIPFLNKDGTVSRPWLYFLIAMNARTGGSMPIPPSALQAQINALFVEGAFDDPQSPMSYLGFAADTLTDDIPAPTLNPFLASLLVADAV
jgi:hypothetical protein